MTYHHDFEEGNGKGRENKNKMRFFSKLGMWIILDENAFIAVFISLVIYNDEGAWLQVHSIYDSWNASRHVIPVMLFAISIHT